MVKNRIKIIGITVVSHALTHVAELTFPATALLVTAEFFGDRKEYAEIGFATFVSALLFGVAALPSGRLVDRLGPRRVLLISLFGTGLSLLALSFAPDFTAFTVSLAFVGAFSGLYHPAGTTMITHGLEVHGKAMGAHGMGGNLGLAVTPFFAAALAGQLGWERAYFVIGLLPITMAFFVLFSGIDVVADDPKDVPGAELWPDKKKVLVLPLVVLFIMSIFNGMTYRGLMTFLPSYFAEAVHISWLPFEEMTVGGAMTTAILLLGVVGQMGGGWLADRYKKEKLYTAIFFVTFPVLILLGQISDLPLVLATGLFALLYFGNQPVGNSMLPRYAAPSAHGSIFGLYFFASFGMGSVMSGIAGWVGERYQLSAIFGMLGATLFVSAILGLLLIRSTRDLS